MLRVLEVTGTYLGSSLVFLAAFQYRTLAQSRAKLSDFDVIKNASQISESRSLLRRNGGFPENEAIETFESSLAFKDPYYDRCVWHEESSLMSIEDSATVENVLSTSYDAYRASAQLDPPIQSCRVQQWTAIRIGPFHTNGGFTWPSGPGGAREATERAPHARARPMHAIAAGRCRHVLGFSIANRFG